jgi:SAM-dependent methyltransferase
MATSTDQWASGAAYEAYMGRWSRMLARPFVEWLRVAPGAHWLEVGCGTGALTSAICAIAKPEAVVACDPAEPFVGHTKSKVTDPRASFVVTGLEALPKRDGGFDAVVSGLVLNFIPNPEQALAKMRDRAARNGVVAAYVWDYSGGFELLKHFWAEAVALDPKAAPLDEGARFPLCHAPALASLFEAVGFDDVQTTALDIPTTFSDFDDLWTPFLGGTGPAPAYVVSLEAEQRDALKERLKARIRTEADGTIRLTARALGVRGRVAG